MTPDSTQPDASATEPATDESEELRVLIEDAQCVLFDFDGPICRLFAGHSAGKVAEEQVRWLEEQGLHGLLESGVRDEADPYVVLRAVDERHPDSDLVVELEARLTREEQKAVPSAWPTPYADALVRTWTATGARLAVTTNNSPGPVAGYLADRGLIDCFAPRIYGRTQDLHLLKPDPYCVNRALTAMGADPARALMIGDAASDYQAATAAGVRFLGYARNARKEAALRRAGAAHVVDSLEPVLRTLRREMPRGR
ncbi:HAD family hydrolase [Streptomyces aurantiacus]|uniref:Putative Phosphoglycolate phosphatase n=1 Tax=Streptomyces aurantiacus JA 4570 TaxID=1286094 RepID=S4A5J5_9ACTN|nr:HAD family hydrolase [Streptomyces aurantiacus]EPH46010.1 putative Phosphoglycolate phosphatase [Streptomyces aurantiacus JA 4570]